MANALPKSSSVIACMGSELRGGITIPRLYWGRLRRWWDSGIVRVTVLTGAAAAGVVSLLLLLLDVIVQMQLARAGADAAQIEGVSSLIWRTGALAAVPLITLVVWGTHRLVSSTYDRPLRHLLHGLRSLHGNNLAALQSDGDFTFPDQHAFPPPLASDEDRPAAPRDVERIFESVRAMHRSYVDNVAAAESEVKTTTEEFRSLRTTARQHRLMAEHLPEGLLLIDRSGRIRSVNAAARELLGLDGDDELEDFRLSRWLLQHRHGVVERLDNGRCLTIKKLREEKLHYDNVIRLWDDLVGRLGQHAARREYNVALHLHLDAARAPSQDGGSPVEQQPEKQPEDDGQDITALRLQLTPIQQSLERQPDLPEAPNYAVLLTVQDISQERELERHKNNVVASVSHELRTPLASIKAYTATLLRDVVFQREAQDKFLRTIYRQCNRLTRLINQLLDISEVESRTVAINPEPTDLAEVARTVVRGMEVLDDRSRISIELGDIPLVDVDRDRIEQVFFNLLDNAVKYSPDGGPIHIRGEAAQDQVRIDILDRGLGVPEEQTPRIFDKFYRLEDAERRVVSGSGLGLYIVRSIIDLHHGSVEASAREGGGTRVSFHLPAAFAQPSPEHPEPQEDNNAKEVIS